MAALTKASSVGLSSRLPSDEHALSGFLAGEDIAIGDACYIKSDGKIWRSTGAAADAAAKVDGFAARAAKAGQPVTLYHDVNFNYASGMTPGTRYYLSGTAAGGLDTAASTGGTAPVAFAIDATRLRVMQSRY